MSNFPSLKKSSFLGEQQNPFRAIANMQRELDQVFENFWSGNVSKGLAKFASVAMEPLSTLEVKDTHYLLSLDVPGFSKDDIKVEVQDDQLHIYGEKKEDRGEKKGMKFESSYGTVEQWLTLPPNTKAETLEAQIENGVLRVAIPKNESSRTKEVKVVEGKTGIFSKLLDKKEKAA